MKRIRHIMFHSMLGNLLGPWEYNDAFARVRWDGASYDTAVSWYYIEEVEA